jgi:hypothetical protein
LNLPGDTDLTHEAERQPILKEPVWKDLHGAAGRDLIAAFAEFKKRERGREDSPSTS